MSAWRFVFWTIYPNIHQRAWIDALRRTGCDVAVCYFRHYDNDRVKLGWQEPECLPEGEYYVRSVAEAKQHIADYTTRTIILTGYYHAIEHACLWDVMRRRAAWVMLTEGSQRRWRSWPIRKLYGWCANLRARHAFAIGANAVDDLIHGWGIRARKVSHLPYVTPVAPPPTKPRTPSEGHRFVFAGALIPRKGIDHLAAAWARHIAAHPADTLRIVGEGPLASLIQDLPGVQCMGTCPPEQIHEHLSACDTLILPSRYDGWGMVLSEALRDGCTLIASDLCGAAESLIIPGRNGYIYPADDIDALTFALEDAPRLTLDQTPLAATEGDACAAEFLRVLGDAPATPVPERFLHVVAGCWATGGGLSELVAGTVLAQARQGKRVSLATLGGQPEHRLLREARRAGVTVYTFERRAPHAIYYSSGLCAFLHSRVGAFAHLYIYSCWTYPTWCAAAVARRARVPYTISPVGCLNPAALQFSRLKKRLAWIAFDRRNLRAAQWIHAASELEATGIRNALGKPCPAIRVIANGIDGEALDRVAEQPRTKTFLFLGRLHPLKGIDLLLSAWERIHLPSDWELVIAGPNEGIEERALQGVRYVGMLEGEARIKALKSAACLVLPSRSENFGLVVGEALWCRTPAISTQATPWPELGEFWVPVTAEALAEAILQFVALAPEARERAFATAFDRVRLRCNWRTIAQQLSLPE